MRAPELGEARRWQLQMRNTNNPSNQLTLCIEAEVTVLRLRYIGLHWAGRAGKRRDPRNAAGVHHAADSLQPLADQPADAARPEAEELRAADAPKVELTGELEVLDDEEDGARHPIQPTISPGELDEQLDRVRVRYGGHVLAAVPFPPLLHPTLPSTPACAAQFSLHNSSREPLQLQLQFRQELASGPDSTLSELRTQLVFELLSGDTGAL